MSAVKAFFAPFFSAGESVSHGGLAGQLNVGGNLLLKGFHVGEAAVAAQAFKEADFDVAAIQVGSEAGHMELEFKLWIVGGIEGGAAAVVEHGAVAGAANEGLDDIDAGGGQDFVMRIEVGRGEAELAADAAAALDGAEDAEGVAEEGGGGIQIACGDGGAQAGAGDGLAAAQDGRGGRDGEIQLTAEMAQERNVAGAGLAEVPVVADMDIGQAGNISLEVAHKGFGFGGGEGAGEGQQDDAFDAEAAQQCEAVTIGGEQAWRLVVAEYAQGVLVEGEDPGAAAEGFGGGEGIADNLEMAEVEAIKESGREHDRASFATQGVGMSDGKHD